MEGASGRGERKWPRVAAAALAAAALFLFPLCFPLNFLAGYPGARIRLRLGPLPAWVALLAAAILVSLAAGLLIHPAFGAAAGLFFLAVIGVPALLLAGWAIRGWPWERALTAATAIVLAALLAGWGVYGIVVGRPAGESLRLVLEEEFDRQLDGLEAGGTLPAEKVEVLRQALGEASRLTGRFLPAVLGIWFITGLVSTAALLARSRRPGEPGQVPPFDRLRLRMPMGLAWPFILCGLLSLVRVAEVRTWCYNALIILGFMFFLVGSSILSYYLAEWRLPRLVRVLLYLLVLSQLAFCLVLAGLGLFDPWIDFRRLRRSADRTGKGT